MHGADSRRDRAKIAGLTVLLCLGLMVGAAACGDAPRPLAGQATAGPSATVVARVDGEPVTKEDVEAVMAQLRLEGEATDAPAARMQAIRRLLVRREAERLDIVVDADAVAARISAVRAKSGGAEALAAGLAAAGMTHEQLADVVSDGLIEEALLAKKYAALEAGPAAVRTYYRKHRRALFMQPATVRLGDITLPTEGLAHKVRAELARSAIAFSAAARRYSMGQTITKNDGMLGWVSTATLPAEVDAAIGELSAGEVSRPVRSFGRWHLFKLYGRRAAAAAPFEDVADEIRTELTRRRRAAALDEWVSRERQRVEIELVP